MYLSNSELHLVHSGFCLLSVCQSSVVCSMISFMSRSVSSRYVLNSDLKSLISVVTEFFQSLTVLFHCPPAFYVMNVTSCLSVLLCFCCFFTSKFFAVDPELKYIPRPVYFTLGFSIYRVYHYRVVFQVTILRIKHQDSPRITLIKF